ncbi:MAG: EamA family transporter [Acidobacteria bacterium]|nr:EamA family transporter [Acidobacteriota bacterium]
MSRDSQENPLAPPRSWIERLAQKPPGTFPIVVCYALLCAIWGTTWAVIQIGLESIPPFSGAALRFAVAAVILLLLAALLGVRLGTSRRERILWLINGALSFTLTYGIVYWSEQWVPSALASVLFATYPLFMAVLAHLFLPSEPMKLLEAFGILAGFGGVAVIFSEDLSSLGGAGMPMAALVMLISPLVAAVSSVIVKRWGHGVHPFSLAGVPMAIAAGALGALALVTERNRSFTWNTTSIAAILYLAIFGSAITFTLYYWLLSHLPAKRMSLIAYVIPVVAILIGVMRGEPLTSRLLLGSAIVITGVALSIHRPA